MATDREPQGAKRTAWNVAIALLVIAILIGLAIALIGGGGAEENEQALLLGLPR